MPDTPPTQDRESGAELIAAERQRQMEEKGWTPEHDSEHVDGELTDAAVAYLWADPGLWPWGPTDRFDDSGPLDRLDRLVKAGALIAAEIDRLQADA